MLSRLVVEMEGARTGLGVGHTWVREGACWLEVCLIWPDVDTPLGYTQVCPYLCGVTATLRLRLLRSPGAAWPQSSWGLSVRGNQGHRLTVYQCLGPPPQGMSLGGDPKLSVAASVKPG